MRRGILAVGKHELVVGKLDVFEHAFAFSDEFFPVFEARLMYVGNHYPAPWCPVVGKQVDVVADGFDGAVLQIHVGSHLYELCIGHTKVAHVQVHSRACTAFVEEHHGLFLVQRYRIEAQGVGRVLVEQHVLPLWRAYFVVVNLVYLILRAILLALLGGIVGTVVEAVATPLRTSELRPFYVVGQQFARRHVLNVYFLPVAAAARDDVSHVSAIFREAYSLQSHGAVGAQLVRIEKLVECSSEFVHLVEDALVLQPVVLKHIPFAVLFEGSTYLFVVCHLL